MRYDYGNNPLTEQFMLLAEVEIVDREALILDLAENARNEQGWLLLTHRTHLIIFYLKDLVWHTVDERTVIPVEIFRCLTNMDIRITMWP